MVTKKPPGGALRREQAREIPHLRCGHAVIAREVLALRDENLATFAHRHVFAAIVAETGCHFCDSIRRLINNGNTSFNTRGLLFLLGSCFNIGLGKLDDSQLKIANY